MSSESDIAVSVRGLSKAYTIAHNDERHVTLAEQLLSRLKNPFKRTPTETFHALQDLNFDIHKGDVVGIIGRNGAGKSTLLKILSRITEPTAGEIRLYGRVGSLLEVGTGFHPELTGRENIYLNGQILGMRKREIDKQFDAIVDFAGVEKFLDTPVKRYSSGMYVRLAFAVAAHLESEILIVDEVLAVGDAEFQKKCMGKMKDVATGGRTVLLVSHNMNAVTNLCNQAIFLAGGRLVQQGDVEEAVLGYASFNVNAGSVNLSDHPNRGSQYRPHFQSMSIQNVRGEECAVFEPEESVVLKFRITTPDRIRSLHIGVGVTSARGERVFCVANYLSPDERPSVDGTAEVTAEFRMPPVVPGRYLLDISLSGGLGYFLDEIKAASSIEVLDNDYLKSAAPVFAEIGTVLAQSHWTTRRLTA